MTIQELKMILDKQIAGGHGDCEVRIRDEFGKPIIEVVRVVFVTEIELR